MEPTQITDHAGQANSRLTHHLQGAPNLEALITALVSGTQRLEDAAFALLTERSISTAVGVQLDRLGQIFNHPRESGQLDPSYRAALYSRAGQLGQSGTPELLISVYVLLWEDLQAPMDPAPKVALVELQPATVQLTARVEADTNNVFQDAAIIQAMDQVKAVGVRPLLQACEEPCFLWGNAADADANGDLPASAFGFGASTDTDANGNIAPGVGGGNLGRVLGFGTVWFTLDDDINGLLDQDINPLQ